jgi:malto-oligosyltrehalose trehalohydrolase
VRDFFIHNALYWLEEFHFDGLRLDAVHAIVDASELDIVTEIAAAVRAGPGRDRHVHLVLENDANDARYLVRGKNRKPRYADAQWNDDFHHALHVLITGETDGYYADYSDRPVWRLGRTLAEGFGYQGEASAHRKGARRGKPSGKLTPVAFVNFLQCHDQVGNRAFGERIAKIGNPEALRLGVTCLLLAPAVPMLFMGEEFAASTPFQFFCDFGPELAAAVCEGRRREFASFDRFRDPNAQASIPDPGSPATFESSKLNWDESALPGHAEWHTLYADLLQVRRLHIQPYLAGVDQGGSFELVGTDGLAVDWALAKGARLHLRANFSGRDRPDLPTPPGERIYATQGALNLAGLPAWGATWTLEPPDA